MSKRSPPLVISPSPSVSVTKEVIESRWTPSTRAFAPPLSPPPTSPLPPTPVSDVFLITNHKAPPPRPPRPQTSLPNLRPRTIVSPEPGQRDLCRRLASPELSRHSYLQSPFTSPSRSSSTHDVSRSSSIRGPRRPAPSPPQTEHPDSFTDAIRAALPQLFSPPVTSPARVYPPFPSHPPHTPSRSNAWPFALSSPRVSTVRSSPITSPGHPTSRNNTTKTHPHHPTSKDVARSALFIPSSPPTNQSSSYSSFIDPYNRHRQDEPLLFPQPYTTTNPFWNTDDEGIITSLPPLIPLHSSARSSNSNGSTASSSHPIRSFRSIPNRTAQHRHVGYPIHTVTNLEAEKDCGAAVVSSNRAGVGGGVPDVGADGVDGEATEQHQSWYLRRHRYVWMLATLIIVLLASAGVLGGLIWRLSRE